MKILLLFTALVIIFSCASQGGERLAIEEREKDMRYSKLELAESQIHSEEKESNDIEGIHENLIEFSVMQKEANTAKKEHSISPITEIMNANNRAVQEPYEEIIFHSQVVYNFQENFLYKVYTSPQRVTLLRLEPGEKVFGDIVSGDTANWIIAKSEDSKRDIIYLKPIREHISTNLVINTNRRTYYLVLKSLVETYMVSVEWKYPSNDLLKKKKSHVIDLAVNIQNLNFGYKLLSRGKDPAWLPLKVFDDGIKTYIQFKSRLDITEKPVLFSIEKNKASLVNYRVVDEYYVVDKLLIRAELRVGNKKRDAVKIVRL